MHEIKCPGCGVKFLTKELRKKYCSNKCNLNYYYIINKNKRDKESENWKINNPERTKELRKKALDKFRKNKPERFNELMRVNYRRNKDKQKSRSYSGRYKKEIFSYFDNKCCKCSSAENLEIHHKNYSINKPKKEDSFLSNIKKVELLCRKCHTKEHILK